MKVLYLNVSYIEKDKVKALGARWNPELKKWYVKMDADFSLFAKWSPEIKEFSEIYDGKESDQKSIDKAYEHIEFYNTCPIIDHAVLGECRFVGNKPFYWQ